MKRSFCSARPTFVEKITQRPVQILGPGSSNRTVLIVHQDGSTQEQFLSLLVPKTQPSQK